jgi:hypothetical protein
LLLDKEIICFFGLLGIKDLLFAESFLLGFHLGFKLLSL